MNCTKGASNSFVDQRDLPPNSLSGQDPNNLGFRRTLDEFIEGGVALPHLSRKLSSRTQASKKLSSENRK